MNIDSKYSKIVRKTLIIPLVIIVFGIILSNIGIGGSHTLLWIGLIILELIPLLGLSVLLIYYARLKDKENFITALVITLFIIINILINFLG
ncbi:MAG TPA: hypothetical protein ENG40_04360 [Thermoprotei archaeon]|nr:hypothetical protein [Thermoprotei archaeon]